MRKPLILFILLLTTVLSACKKDEIQSDFDKSYQAWLAFKKSSGNTYSYTVTTSSWTGFRTKTIIKVNSGGITGRSYERYGYATDTSNNIVLQEEWTETKLELNTHEQGAALMTLDQVYEKAKNEWLNADRKENEITFKAENNGLISACGYTPINCADDCFFGIYIDSITIP